MSDKKVKINKEFTIEVKEKVENGATHKIKFPKDKELTVGENKVETIDGKSVTYSVTSGLIRDYLTVTKVGNKDVEKQGAKIGGQLFGWNWGFWLSIFLALAAVGLAVWYFFFRKNKEEEEESL